MHTVTVKIRSFTFAIALRNLLKTDAVEVTMDETGGVSASVKWAPNDFYHFINLVALKG